jgi:hypothetical protein
MQNSINSSSLQVTAMPTDDTGKKDKDINTSKLKNVTPKVPVHLQLPVEKKN